MGLSLVANKHQPFETTLNVKPLLLLLLLLLLTDWGVEPGGQLAQPFETTLNVEPLLLLLILLLLLLTDRRVEHCGQ